MDEPIDPSVGDSPSGRRLDADESQLDRVYADPVTPKLDPPDDEPPSLHKESTEWSEPVPDPEDPSVFLSPSVAPSSVFFQTEPLSPEDEDEPNEFPQDEFGAAASSTTGAVFRNRPDPIYTGVSPSQHEHMEGTEHFGYVGEEKKQQLDIDSMKSGEEDFIPIKRNPYQLTPSSGYRAAETPHSVDSLASHHSAAFKSAQELLRKNRRRRQEE